MNKQEINALVDGLKALPLDQAINVVTAMVTPLLSAEVIEWDRARKAKENPDFPGLFNLLSPRGWEVAARVGQNALRLASRNDRLASLYERTIDVAAELLQPIPQPVPGAVTAPATNLAYVPKVLCA